jgi:FKBP-type peptidyl-prolyl cis-trans isomerase
MRIKYFLFVLVALGVAFLTGCEDEVDSTVYQDQEDRYFDLYIAANYSDLVPDEDGLYYINYVEGTGATPDTSDYLLINFVAYTIPDENVVDTYTEDIAVEHNVYTSGAMYGPYKFHLGSEILGLQKGLTSMKVGGISRILFKSDLGHGSIGWGNLVKGYESMMYDIELLEVIDDVYEQELAMIDAYLDTIDNVVEIYDADTDATMYYIPDEIGTGAQIETDNELEIFYTGKLLDGRQFDSNTGENSGLDVTIGAESVITGWELGLLKFNYGGSGRLLIPHQLAYGEDGNILTGSLKYSIPPYEALLFSVSVEPEPVEEDEVE